MEQKNKATLTIFTPAYNRAYSLHLCYESLLRQSCKDFIWMIIDDGSTDNTRELVQGWMAECKEFEIRYLYKKNGGMHTAHNMAYESIDTELNMCIDSDDYVADGAVEKIISFWRKNGSNEYAGLIGLDATFDNQIIGKGFPTDLRATTLMAYYANGGAGDKKLVYRTEIMKKYPPYPEFEGERYVGLAYKYMLCDQEYKLLVLNEILCNVEYQPDGSSMNMYRQYLRNPKGFAFFRKTAMCCQPKLKRRFVECIHYVSSSIIDGNTRFIKESPKKLMTAVAIPFGFALTCYIRYKAKGHMYIEGQKK